MIHPRMFLGITAGLLALAGVLAAKSAKLPTIIASYHTNGPGSDCVSLSYAVQATLIQGLGKHLARTNGSTGRTLYEAGSFCNIPLYTNRSKD